MIGFLNDATVRLILLIAIAECCVKAEHVNLYNWAGTFQFSTRNIQYPRSLAQVQQIVRGAEKLRALGRGHSFSRCADSNDTILQTVGLKSILTPSWPGLGGTDIDPSKPTVLVQAGITYTDLAPFLQDAGYALQTLSGLAEISVGGATQTGAHGSGNANGCLASQVRGMELVLANGSVVFIGDGDARLGALAAGLGAFGVVTALELGLEPTYNVSSHVFLDLPHSEFMANFDEIMSAGYSVGVYSDFALPNVWNQVWVYERADGVGGTIRIGGGRHRHLANTSARLATEQVSLSPFLAPSYMSRQGVEQPWYLGLVQYHYGTLAFGEYRNSFSGVESGGDELQAEYLVPHANATAAIDTVAQFWSELAPLVLIAGIRTVQCDSLWLSMSYCEPELVDAHEFVVSIALEFRPDQAAVDPVLARVEQALLPFGARPHWAKHFLVRPEQFLHTYPRHAEFVELAKQFDPSGKFCNDFLQQNVFV